MYGFDNLNWKSGKNVDFHL